MEIGIFICPITYLIFKKPIRIFLYFYLHPILPVSLSSLCVPFSLLGTREVWGNAFGKEELENLSLSDTKGEGIGPMLLPVWAFAELKYHNARDLFWDASLNKEQDPIVIYFFHDCGTEFGERSNSMTFPGGKCSWWRRNCPALSSVTRPVGCWGERPVQQAGWGEVGGSWQPIGLQHSIGPEQRLLLSSQKPWFIWL